MRTVFGALAALLLSVFAAPAQSVDAERLQAMWKAAANLEYLASLKESSGGSLPPSSPEVAPLLAAICNAKEAESFGHATVDQFKTLQSYSQHVTAALKVFMRPSAPPASLFAPEVEPCIDGSIWLDRALLNVVKRLFAENPTWWQDPKRLDGRRKAWLSAIVQMHAVLRSFRLRDVVEPAWCEARMRPLLALADVTLEEVPQNERERLRVAVRAAETCSPGVKPGLQALYEKLNP